MRRETRLIIVLGLDVTLVAALVAVGVTAHSLGVLAAGGDYLADTAAVGISLLAISLSRRPATNRRPRGYPKATTVAALVNAVLLFGVVTFVVAEAAHRLVVGVGEVDGLPMLIVSAVAAVFMAAGAVVLRGDVGQDDDDEGDAANMRAVLLDTVADAAAAGGVAVSGAIIAITKGFYWLDPVVAMVIALIIGYHVVALLRDLLANMRRPTP